jgi:hypothetical protein
MEDTVSTKYGAPITEFWEVDKTTGKERGRPLHSLIFQQKNPSSFCTAMRL